MNVVVKPPSSGFAKLASFDDECWHEWLGPSKACASGGRSRAEVGGEGEKIPSFPEGDLGKLAGICVCLSSTVSTLLRLAQLCEVG